MTDVRQQVASLACRVFHTDEIVDMPDLDLVDAGLLDSLAFVELIVGLEEIVGERIPPTDVDRSELSSLNKIYAFVEEYQ